jgi:hypothetical protein
MIVVVVVAVMIVGIAGHSIMPVFASAIVRMGMRTVVVASMSPVTMGI